MTPTPSNVAVSQVTNSAYTFTFSTILTPGILTPGVTILTYSWNFGDGIGTSTEATPTYTYRSAGTWHPVVTVTLSAGFPTYTPDTVITPAPPSPRPPVTIASIRSLPGSPYYAPDIVNILITNGANNFFEIIGSNLNRIVSVKWLPKNSGSVLQESRNIILIDDTHGTFMIRILNNYLDITDRAGHISFTLDDQTTLAAPVRTFGPPSFTPLWQNPNAGLSTGS